MEIMISVFAFSHHSLKHNLYFILLQCFIYSINTGIVLHLHLYILIKHFS